MATDSLLSDLCSICYTETPKYRCPRCRTRTCSLPCYKKHQQRATCNGKRDPAEYLKKSQFATAAGIDRDYNFLKGIEGQIEHADRDTNFRIGGENSAKIVSRGTNPTSRLHNYFSRNRINVTRAPAGMSRQKANNTRCTKRDHIFWTVEWIESDGTGEIISDCHEAGSLSELYRNLQTQRSNTKKRNHQPEVFTPTTGAGKKRKRKEAAPAEPEQASEKGTSAGAGPNEGDHESGNEEVADMVEPAVDPDDVSSTQPTKTEDPEIRQGPENHFYLLKPGTTSASKVLIPIDSHKTLTEALTDQAVLEFPTVYVLPNAPTDLPDQFLLEKQYKKIRQEEEQELQSVMQQAGRLAGDEKPAAIKAEPSTMDANKILEMLKRDVTR